MNGTEHIIIQDRLTGVSAYVGLPASLADMGIMLADDTIKAIADSTVITPGCCKRLTPDEIEQILRECR